MTAFDRAIWVLQKVRSIGGKGRQWTAPFGVKGDYDCGKRRRAVWWWALEEERCDDEKEKTGGRKDAKKIKESDKQSSNGRGEGDRQVIFSFFIPKNSCKSRNVI